MPSMSKCFTSAVNSAVMENPFRVVGELTSGLILPHFLLYKQDKQWQAYNTLFFSIPLIGCIVHVYIQETVIPKIMQSYF